MGYASHLAVFGPLSAEARKPSLSGNSGICLIYLGIFICAGYGATGGVPRRWQVAFV